MDKKRARRSFRVPQVTGESGEIHEWLSDSDEPSESIVKSICGRRV
jgi:hypothetical protein